MHVVAFDPFVSAERYRELGVEKAESPAEVYAQADFVTIHLPVTPETRGLLDAEAFAQMQRRRARDQLRARRAGRRRGAQGRARLRQGRGRRARRLPVGADHRLPAVRRYDNVVVTPHLGASTTEAQDRAGSQTAEQIVAALTPGGVVTTAVNIPAISPEDMEVLGPFLPLCRQLGRLAVSLAEGSSIDRVEVEYLGRIAERDTRLLTVAVLMGVLAGHVEEEVNAVNAPGLAEERGIDVVRDQAHDRARLHRPRARDDRQRRRAHARRRHDARPPQPPAPARGLGPALQPPARGRTSRSSATATCRA